MRSLTPAQIKAINAKNAREVPSILAKAPSSIVEFVPAGGLNLWNSVLYHFNLDYCDKATAAETFAQYCYLLSCILKRAPGLLTPRDAAISYVLLAQNRERDIQEKRKFDLPDACPQYKKLQQLIEKYYGLESDEAVLKHLQCANDEWKNFADSYEEKLEGRNAPLMLKYAMHRHFSQSVIYGLTKIDIDELWHYREFKSYRHRIADELDARIARGLTPEEKPKLLSSLTRCVVLKHLDFLNDFTEHVVLPAAHAMHAQGPVTPQTAELRDWNDDHALMPSVARYFVSQLLEEGKNYSQILDHFTQLERTWKHTQFRGDITIPYSTIPILSVPTTHAPSGTLWPLLRAPFTTKSYFDVRSIRDDAELDDVLQRLGYSPERRAQWKHTSTNHFVVIEKKYEGELSIAELELVAPGQQPYGKRHVHLSGGDLVLKRHEGKAIAESTRLPINAPMIEALHELLDHIATGFVPLNIKGKYNGNASLSNFATLQKKIGYYPSWENIDIAFQEFKKESRAGSTGWDANGHVLTKKSDLVYTAPAAHLIHGTVEVDGKILSLRDMNAREWLRATGLYETVLETNKSLLKQEEKRPITASLPAPPTKEELAQAYSSGTLPSTEIQRLSAKELAFCKQQLLANKGQEITGK